MRSALTVLIPLLSCACGDYRDIQPSFPADVDPGTRLERDWIEAEAIEPDEPLRAARLVELTRGDGAGWLISGTLEGTGTGPGEPVLWTAADPDCAPGPRIPVGDDYLYEVDTLRIEARDPGTLCMQLAVAGPRAVDAVLWELDDCGLPLAPVEAADGILGAGIAQAGRWEVQVPALSQWAIILGGPGSEDPMPVDWRMAVSLVIDGGGDWPGLCPTADL